MSLYAKINHDMPSKTVLFSLATSGPLALRSIVLVFAATHLAWIHGLNDSVQSTQHKSQVLCDLRSRVAKITSGRSIDAGGDDTIAAIFGMASFEVNEHGTVTDIDSYAEI